MSIIQNSRSKMTQQKVAIIIPVRLASTRLPNKPLADILGKSMTQRVYEKAVESGLGDVFVACDGQEIADEVAKFGGKAVITDPNLPSGTDRVYACAKSVGKDYDLIVNLQGDLPNIDPLVLESVVNAAISSDADISTVASTIKERQEISDPNVVKIAIAFKEQNRGQALYFSRTAIPYSKNQNANYYHHIGIYAFKPQALSKFISLPASPLEKQESLEQLRALENGMKIAVEIVDTHPLSVDTQEDLDKVTAQIKENS